MDLSAKNATPDNPATTNQSSSVALHPVQPANTSSNPSVVQDSPSSSAQSPSSLQVGSTKPKPNITRTLVASDSARAIYVAGHSVNVSHKCPKHGESMSLTIVVMSAPKNHDARNAIRKTWGSYDGRRDVALAFMVGVSVDPKIERNLQQESTLYEDIIRGNFIDSYSNLTLKTISTLEWVNTYCPNAKFLLKADDDMFINVERLIKFAEKHAKDKRTIFGRVAKKWKPIRNKQSKYFVSQAQFKQVLYPDFTTGPSYLVTQDAIGDLLEGALNQTYLKLEDVFVTGIVASKLAIKRIQVNEFQNRKISYSVCNVQKAISIHMVKYGEQFDLWKKLQDGKMKCK